MEPITSDVYYTIVFPAIIVALPIIYLAASLLWNRKLVPAQRRKGKNLPNFGKIIGEYVSIGFKETVSLLPSKVENKLLKNLFNFRTINWLLLIATIGTLAIYNNDVWMNAWLPALLLFTSVWAGGAPLISKRKAIHGKMFTVAETGLRYDRAAALDPTSYVKVKKWEGATPKEIVVTIPVKFDASTLDSRKGFERHFNGTVTEENSWVYEWETVKGFVEIKPIAHIPAMVPYPGSTEKKWYEIPLGLGLEGEVVADLSIAPHMLITGVTGSGKSVLQRNIIFHCIQHNDNIRMLGVDVKRVELSPFKKYSQTILGIGTNLEDGVDVVRYAKRVMEKRYEKMEEQKVNHFKDLKDENGKPDYALLVMIDEAYMFMATEGGKSDDSKARDELHGEASTMLGEIARLGRAAGVHLIMATQRPDAKVIYGELKLNLPVRIAAGRLDSTASSMTLDSASAAYLPSIKGRGMLSIYGVEQEFQGYFAEQDWIDQWLEQHPGREPEVYPALDKKPELAGAGDLDEIIGAEGYDFNNGALDHSSPDLESGELSDYEKQLDANLIAKGVGGLTTPAVTGDTGTPAPEVAEPDVSQLNLTDELDPTTSTVTPTTADTDVTGTTGTVEPAGNSSQDSREDGSLTIVQPELSFPETSEPEPEAEESKHEAFGDDELAELIDKLWGEDDTSDVSPDKPSEETTTNNLNVVSPPKPPQLPTLNPVTPPLVPENTPETPVITPPSIKPGSSPLPEFPNIPSMKKTAPPLPPLPKINP